MDCKNCIYKKKFRELFYMCPDSIINKLNISGSTLANEEKNAKEKSIWESERT